LTEAEQRAAGAAHVVLSKRRKMRRPQRLQASRTEDLAAGKRHKPSYRSVTTWMLGDYLRPIEPLIAIVLGCMRGEADGLMKSDG
jgi:hypothetical protein